MCKDCAVQCCLIPAPSLKPIDVSSCASDTEADTETEGETDSSSYVPYEETTQTEKYPNLLSLVHVNNNQFYRQIAPVPVHQQKKYVIFEGALMELFDKCEKCGKGGTFVKKKVTGTFIRLKQTCNNCDHMREWDSQPFIKNIPAGNILLSASILFGGGLPSQVTFIMRLLHAHTHTLNYHIHYTHALTDVAYSGSFWMCINLLVYLLQPSAFLFAAHHLLCVESPPIVPANSSEEYWKKTYFRW